MLSNTYFRNSGEPCEKDLDCGLEDKCRNEKCFKACKDDNDCTYENKCVNKICLPKTCQEHSDCGPGYQCIDKTCYIKCQSKQDCPNRMECDDEDICAVPEEGPCDKKSGDFQLYVSSTKSNEIILATKFGHIILKTLSHLFQYKSIHTSFT